jgi:hypothetical protein
MRSHQIRPNLESLEDRALMDAGAHCGCGGVVAPAPVDDAPAQIRIVNGTPTSGFAAVGLVGDRSDDFCSGTLIGDRWVLTAGHCAEGVGATQGRFTVGGNTYSTSQVYVHPQYNANRIGEDSANDIALYQLSQPVTGIQPMQIFRGTPTVGQLLTLVGFGAGGTGNGGHNGDFGTKRVGTTPIDGVTPKLITWRFDNNSESNTAPGDSGGPAFVQVGGIYYVAGVTSGGSRNDAGIGDNSFDTRVDAYASWIDSLMGTGGGGGGGGTTDDHGDDPATATLVTLSSGVGTAAGILETEGDVDFFKFTPSFSGTVVITLRATGSLDPMLGLYNANGQLLRFNDDYDGLNSRVSYRVTAGRTYYVEATGYDDSTGGYNLRIARSGRSSVGRNISLGADGAHAKEADRLVDAFFAQSRRRSSSELEFLKA